MRQSSCVPISIVAVVLTLAIVATLSAIGAAAGASHTNPLSGHGKNPSRNAMMSAFAGRAGAGGNSSSYEQNCSGDEVFLDEAYDGVSLHPYDTIFQKTNRAWNEQDRLVIDRLSQYADANNYTSYDHCK